MARQADGSEREQVEQYQAPSYDAAFLRSSIAETAEHEAAWHDWFGAQRIAPLRLTYEELSAEPVATVKRLLAALGRDPAMASRVAPRTARLADAESAQWIARFRAEH